MVQIFVNSGRIVLRQIEEVNDGGKNINDYGNNLWTYKNENESKDIDDGSNAKRARREDTPDNVSMPEKKPSRMAGEEIIDMIEEDRDLSAESITHTSEKSATAMYNDYVDSSADSLRSEGFTRTSVANLRELATELRIDISDCIEKKEMTDRIIAAVSQGR